MDGKKIPLAGLICAAGLSSRMGRLKALLPFGEGSIISRCVDNMLAAGATTVVVVTGHRAEEIEAHLEGRGCVFVRNPDYAHNQMFDSVCLGLKALAGRVERVLISPVDVPAVKGGTLEKLISGEGNFIVPVCDGKRGHPILLDASLIPAIISHNGEGGLRGALEAAGVTATEVSCDDPGCLMDADTPEAYEKLLKLL